MYLRKESINQSVDKLVEFIPIRTNFSNLFGTWKHGVGVPVGFMAKYFVAFPVL